MPNSTRPTETQMDHTDAARRTSPLLIAAAWIVVIVPAGWGLRYTVQNALKLFASPTAAAAAPPAAPPAVH